MKDLTHIVDYKQAIIEREWLFFFMRGVEAYFMDYSQPHYLGNATAHSSWRTGKEAARKESIDRQMGRPAGMGEFCKAFLRGDTLFKPTKDQLLGIHYRKLAEAMLNDGELHAMYYRATYGDAKKALYNEPKKAKSKMANPKTLYKVKGEDLYGNIVGENSEGEMILELRGQAGAVKPYKPDLLEEVMPYTIQVHIGDYRSHYTANKGDYAKGDIVVVKDDDGITLGEVLAIDTKQRNADEHISRTVLGVLMLKTKPA